MKHVNKWFVFMRRGIFYSGILFLLFSPVFVLAGQESVRINEVAWMGTSDSYANEWIELKNAGENDVDVSGWKIISQDGSPDIELKGKIKTGGLFLLERTNEDTVADKKADQIYTGSLSNNGETLHLLNSKDEIVDRIRVKDSWPAGDNDTKQTMIRCGNSWENSSQKGGSPKEDNFCKSKREDDQGNESGEDERQEERKNKDPGNTAEERDPEYDKGDVVINEFVSDPAPEEQEWVEIKNYLNKTVDIRGWYIEEGSGSQTKLEKDSLQSSEMLVVEDINGYLNNKGDRILLKNSAGKTMDEIVYGEWQEKEGEVSAPSSRAAVARNSRKELVITLDPTPGKQNIITNKKEDEELKEGSTGSAGLVITEILPNPEGEDKGEFIEFYNRSGQDIDLSGWKLSNKLGQVLEFNKISAKVLGVGEEKIPPGEHFVLYKQSNKLILRNNGGVIRLSPPGQSDFTQELSYGSAEPGVSYASIEHINPDRMSSSTKSFFAHALKNGKWRWSKTPTPGGFNQIKLKNKPPRPFFSFSGKRKPGEQISFDASDTFDENGDDIDYNWDFGDGVMVEDIKTPSHVYLTPGDYQVRLTVSDSRSASGLTKEIIIREASNKEQPSPKEPEPNHGNKEENGLKNKHRQDRSLADRALDNNIDKHYLAVSLQEAKTAPPKTFVRVKGRVAVEPGVLGAQYFYILGPPGLQIYNYYKDFPDLNPGDKIEVQGETSKTRYGEARVKTEEAGDIEVLLHQDPPRPREVKCNDLDQNRIGELVNISGELTEKDANRIYIKDESGRALVYLQEDIDKKQDSLTEGKKLVVTGIASKLEDKVRLLPRSARDIKVMGRTSKAQVLGASSSPTSTTWTLPADRSSDKLWKYLCIVLATILAGASVLLFKKIKE
jgi:hypothetical protein